MSENLQSINILGVKITNETSEKILEYLFHELKKRENQTQRLFFTTPNPEIIVHAQTHPDYKQVLDSAQIALPDGIGVILAGKLLKKPFKERITGTDFVEMVCKRSETEIVSIGLLGGKAGVAEKTAECLKKKYPWIQIVFAGEEWNEISYPAIRSSQATRSKPNKFERTAHLENPLLVSPAIDILFVAFGFPKQEQWIYQNLPKIPVKAAIGIGGAFDYLSGEVARAPYPIRMMGFEWLFRLIYQPWRLRRQLALLTFIYLILKEKLMNKE